MIESDGFSYAAPPECLESNTMKTAVLTLALILNAGLLATPAVAAGDAEAGAKLFTRICGGCHQVGESARGGFGPQLNGIFGRPSGSVVDYQYSDAMKSAGIVWTRETLTAYLEAPKKVVPGTRMIFWGLSDPEKIEDVLAYLQTFQAP
jgi:cytochrome c